MSAATAAPAVHALLDDLRPRLIQASALERLRLVAEYFPSKPFSRPPSVWKTNSSAT
ncbi:hypothetical protein [Hymenobacter sp. 5516J-16]|uniref:hypothetical protein n=1 Tax=Hymenobacter sp. 5516J-16 TaxID=2932253 RepID=UPI00293E1D35|nr:hypothetical protein [Hymenobacter sp. 5516J-16]